MVNDIIDSSLFKVFWVSYAGANNIVTTENSITSVARYDANGRLLSEPTPGINIIKMSDGTTRKEWVK